MRSQLPKVLHPVAGIPMLGHVVAAARAAGCDPLVVVVGHGAEAVRQYLGESVIVAEQRQQLGTGHALLQALPHLPAGVTHTLVLYGDAPLIEPATLQRLAEAGRGATLALITTMLDTPTGYGRILRDERGQPRAIVEEAEADPGQRAIREVNPGFYCFDVAWLAAELPGLRRSAAGEQYLTDLLERAVAQGHKVVTVPESDAVQLLGINDRVQLSRAEAVARARTVERLQRAGVTVIHPETTFVDHGVVVGQDSVIYPNTYLEGSTVIGAGCRIGPSTQIRDSRIGDRCVVTWSVVEQAEVGQDVRIGPYTHLRPGAQIGDGAILGNFAEVKASRIGPHTHMHHFSYIGDGEIGAGVNVGAGTITCNFDGRRKHRTRVGDGAFLGSDTLLVAPVEVGAGAATGAGAVVTRDVAPGTLVVGVPARPLRPVGHDRSQSLAPDNSDSKLGTPE